jgi:hypothetical protein
LLLKAYEYAERLSITENSEYEYQYTVHCGLAKGCIGGGAEHIHVKTKFVVL